MQGGPLPVRRYVGKFTKLTLSSQIHAKEVRRRRYRNTSVCVCPVHGISFAQGSRRKGYGKFTGLFESHGDEQNDAHPIPLLIAEQLTRKIGDAFDRGT